MAGMANIQSFEWWLNPPTPPLDKSSLYYACTNGAGSLNKKKLAVKPHATAACTSKVEIYVIQPILLAMKVVRMSNKYQSDVDGDRICWAQS